MKISYVVPCYNSSGMIESVVEEIRTGIRGMGGCEYEVILVNDASTDGTFDVIRRLCGRHPEVSGISLAGNFGQHAALMAGFRHVSGDIVICLDDDGQTPACEAGRLAAKIGEGYDAVYAEYDVKMHGLLRRAGSRLNMKMAECLLGKPRELYLSSYFAAKRFVIDEVVRYGNPYPYVTGLVLRATKNVCSVKMPHRARMEGKSGYSMKKLVSLWVNGFTSFSVRPLRFASVCGAATAAAGLAYAAWVVLRKFTNPAAPVGWSSTISVMLVIGGMILLVLGMIGEYIGRIYICINNSPQYVIREIIGGKGAGTPQACGGREGEDGRPQD